SFATRTEASLRNITIIIIGPSNITAIVIKAPNTTNIWPTTTRSLIANSLLISTGQPRRSATTTCRPLAGLGESRVAMKKPATLSLLSQYRYWEQGPIWCSELRKGRLGSPRLSTDRDSLCICDISLHAQADGPPCT
ncbi:hypothetical protein BGZ52_008468, partial [Haplosporangium bisporale]